jgi:hypothetical protein
LNVLFVSPAFPPPFVLFCEALREAGARVLGIGDVPPPALGWRLHDVLADYVFAPDLDDDDAVLRAVAGLVHRNGRIDHVDSLNEHWLDLEARIRLDFNVPGARPAETASWRSKTGMGERFARAGLAPPISRPVAGAADVRAFARDHGFPVLIKPDVGVGADGVHVADDEASLERLLAAIPVRGAVAQEYVRAKLVTFDGLADRDGRVVFASSARYAAGVMELSRDGLDVVYHVRRSVPAEVRRVGERVLEAFEVRGRFFHIELFELDDGTVRPLEINMRPPGGFSVDLMNFAGDVDLYRAWAAVVVGAQPAALPATLPYASAHVGRRPWHRYRREPHEIVDALGSALVASPWMPPLLAEKMGAPVFLVRHEDEAELGRLVALALERV